MSDQVEGVVWGPGAAGRRVTMLGWLPSGLDLTRSRACIAVYLIISIPTLFALSLLVGPFQTLDEASHFYRAVQLSEGHVLPVVSPQGGAAGDYLDVNLHKLGGYYAYIAYDRWHKSYGVSGHDDAVSRSVQLAGRQEFVPFSNTVIYAPLAHLAPAAAIWLARGLHATPMSWMYAGRLMNSGLAIVIFCAAMAVFPEGRFFIFVLALLPRTLLGTAALSADALLVPFAALFAGLVCEVAYKKTLSPLQYGLLMFSTLYICLGKLAYIPMAAIPPAIAFLATRRISSPVVVLALSGLATVLLWLSWTHMIGREVFPIRHNVHIDVFGQVQHIIANPIRGAEVLVRSLGKDGFGYLDTLVGGELGSAQSRFPRLFSVATLIALIASAFIAHETLRAKPLELATVFVVVTGCGVAVFLLLYMQYTALDNPVVDGVQGRYFLPLLPILIAFVLKLRVRAPYIQFASGAAILWLSFCSVDTVLLMKARYWHTAAAPGLRFGDPALQKDE